MKNNKGFIRFEVLTLFVIILGIVAYAMYALLGRANSQRFDTMKDSAITFGKTVTTNINSFHNSENIYLGEVIEEKLLKNVKSPFTSGYCDVGESKVQIINGKPYVTLKCDNYLIDKCTMNDKNDIKIYDVSDWSDTLKSGDNIESEIFYNCTDDNGDEIFSDYYEELYFVSLINKENDTDYYSSDEVSVCNVVSKEMYREKNIYDKNN